jgi:hypothetical protein
MLGLLWIFRDDRTDITTTTERAQEGESAELAIALDTDGVLGTVEQIVEHGVPVQAAARVCQFDLLASVGVGQFAATLVRWQGRDGRDSHVALMLLDMPEINEALAGIKGGAGQRRVEHRDFRSACLDCQLHESATDALALVFVTDDHQADRGVVTLRAGERGTDQAAVILRDETLRDALQHGPVLQAMGPFQLHGQRVGRSQVSAGHGAKVIRGALRVLHDIAPWTGPKPVGFLR